MVFPGVPVDASTSTISGGRLINVLNFRHTPQHLTSSSAVVLVSDYEGVTYEYQRADY